MGAVDTARQLDGWGFRVLPARGKRVALATWEEWRDQPTGPMLATWFSGRGERYNFWVMCGRPSGVVVLDVDNDETLAWFRRQDGVAALLDQTCCVRTAKGWHFYFRINADQVVDSRSQHEVVQGVTISWDLRAEGTGVVVPPSTHESGVRYEWIRMPETVVAWDDFERLGRDTQAVAEVQSVVGARRRSQLAKLLVNPAIEGGRNDWLTRIAGHLAKHVPHEDAYLALCAMVNRELAVPLEEEEWRRTISSVWNAENRKDVEPSAETGWLTEKDDCLWTLCQVKSGEESVEVWRPWADFNLIARGVIEMDGDQQYVVDVVTKTKTVRTLLSKKELGEWRRLQIWLAGFGATVAPPLEEHRKAHMIERATRLHRWLMSQSPAHFRAIDSLGFHDGVGFVTHEGVITSGGLQGHGGVMLDPRLRDRTPYRYGFVAETEALDVLREVLTFHDSTVTAVFGAWWVATLLKPQIDRLVSVWPFMALEAPSESGKTTGFFSLMLQLAGSYHGQGEYTLPVLRDRAGAHRSGIVWIDDVSDPTGVLDLLRQASSGGSRSKKAQDRTSEETVRLVASIVLSGEGLGSLGAEKALIDRAIQLEIPPVKGRMSLHDGSRAQWDDILALRARYPDPDGLTAVAGSIVQAVLQHADGVHSLPTLREGSGRHADKVAILLTGARILAELLGDVGLLTRVEEWCRDQEDIGQENYLTMTILPRLLRDHGVPRSPMNDQPAFVDAEGVVWFSEQRVADAWSLYRGLTARDRQLGSLPSIRAQRRALGIDGDGKVFPVGPRKVGTTWQRRYQAMTAAGVTRVSSRVIQRTGMEIDIPQSQPELGGVTPA